MKGTIANFRRGRHVQNNYQMIILVDGIKNKGETKQFANIALGSLTEVEYLIDFCQRLEFISKEDHSALMELRDTVGSLLWGFYRSF